jgi:hypothetical protein
MQDRGRPHEEQPEVHRDPAWKRRRSGDGEHLHRRQPGPNEAGLPVTPTPGSGHGLMPGPVVWNRRDTGGPAHPVRRGSSRPLVPGRRMASGAPRGSTGSGRTSAVPTLARCTGRSGPHRSRRCSAAWDWPTPTTQYRTPPLLRWRPQRDASSCPPPFCLARDEGRFEAASVDLPLFAPQSSRTVGHTAMGESASASRPRGDEGPRRSVTPQNAPRIAYDWTSTSSLEHTPKAGLPVPEPWLSSQP